MPGVPCANDRLWCDVSIERSRSQRERVIHRESIPLLWQSIYVDLGCGRRYCSVVEHEQHWIPRTQDVYNGLSVLLKNTRSKKIESAVQDIFSFPFQLLTSLKGRIVINERSCIYGFFFIQSSGSIETTQLRGLQIGQQIDPQAVLVGRKRRGLLTRHGVEASSRCSRRTYLGVRGLFKAKTTQLILSSDHRPHVV